MGRRDPIQALGERGEQSLPPHQETPPYFSFLFFFSLCLFLCIGGVSHIHIDSVRRSPKLCLLQKIQSQSCNSLSTLSRAFSLFLFKLPRAHACCRKHSPPCAAGCSASWSSCKVTFHPRVSCGHYDPQTSEEEDV